MDMIDLTHLPYAHKLAVLLRDHIASGPWDEVCADTRIIAGDSGISIHLNAYITHADREWEMDAEIELAPEEIGFYTPVWMAEARSEIIIDAWQEAMNTEVEEQDALLDIYCEVELDDDDS